MTNTALLVALTLVLVGLAPEAGARATPAPNSEGRCNRRCGNTSERCSDSMGGRCGASTVSRSYIPSGSDNRARPAPGERFPKLA
jgi:hypothetical protein